MISQLLIFLIKVLLGTTLGVFGIYGFKRKKKMERIFDEFTQDVKDDILMTALRYAKADIDENQLPDDLIEYAVGYTEMFRLTEDDFSGFTALELAGVVGWVGGRPPHRPKDW